MEGGHAQAPDPGAWQRAPQEVIKGRKFVKARRGAPPVASSATGTASNPFAGISLAAPSAPAAAAPAAAQVRRDACCSAGNWLAQGNETQ